MQETTYEVKLRRLYTETDRSGAAFCAKPVPTCIYDLPHGDYTLSDRPLGEWVDWVVGNYERSLAMRAAAGDDSVPTARLTTGTRFIFQRFCETDEEAREWTARMRELYGS